MSSFSKLAFGLTAAFFSLSSAQTYSDCNPMTTNTTCNPNPALSSATFSTDFTAGASASKWTATAGNISYGSDGAEFTIKKHGDAPTIQSDFYIFFGMVEVTMKAASGIGIISSIVMESDDLDEIDWEFIGGDDTQVQTNYFGKGNTTTYDRMQAFPVSSPQTTAHTYAVNWTSSAITWLIDGTAVRTLPYAAANGGSNFPQTPMNVRIGIWAGGDPDNNEGTITWAGGKTDYSAAPFTMSVQSVKVTNYNTGAAYVYTDKSGSWESIKVEQADSGVVPTQSAGGPQGIPTSAIANPSAVASSLAGGVGADTTVTDVVTQTTTICSETMSTVAVPSTALPVSALSSRAPFPSNSSAPSVPSPRPSSVVPSGSVSTPSSVVSNGTVPTVPGFTLSGLAPSSSTLQRSTISISTLPVITLSSSRQSSVAGPVTTGFTELLTATGSPSIPPRPTTIAETTTTGSAAVPQFTGAGARVPCRSTAVLAVVFGAAWGAMAL